MNELKATAGPWFADRDGRIWRRHPDELYENGGGVAGDRPIASAHVGWYGEDVRGYPAASNAALIAAAPTMYEALESLFAWNDSEEELGERCRLYSVAIKNARAALKKARGK